MQIGRNNGILFPQKEREREGGRKENDRRENERDRKIMRMEENIKTGSINQSCEIGVGRNNVVVDGRRQPALFQALYDPLLLFNLACLMDL